MNNNLKNNDFMKFYFLYAWVFMLCNVQCKPRPLYQNAKNTTKDDFLIEYKMELMANSNYIWGVWYDSIVYHKKGPIVKVMAFKTDYGKVVVKKKKSPLQVIFEENEVYIHSSDGLISRFPLKDSDTITTSLFHPFFGNSNYYGEMVKIKGDTMLSIGQYKRPCYRYKQYIFETHYFRSRELWVKTVMNNEFFIDKEWYFPLGAVCQYVNQIDFIPDSLIFKATQLKIRERD
jgi:hypothetical protein